MPSLGDLQSSAYLGLFVSEATSGINGVAVDTIGSGAALNGVAPIASLLTAVPIPQPFEAYTAQLRTTGTFTAGKFTIEGTIDGSNWIELNLTNADTSAPIAIGGFSFTTPAVTLFTNTIDFPVRYIRPRLSGGTTGGTAAFVSMLLFAL